MHVNVSRTDLVRVAHPARWLDRLPTRTDAIGWAAPLMLGAAQAALAAALVLLALARPVRQVGFPVLANDIWSNGGPLRIALFQHAFRWLPGMDSQGLNPGFYLWGQRGALAALALLQVAALVACLRRADGGGHAPAAIWLVGPALTSIVLLAFPPLAADVFYSAISGHAALHGANPYIDPTSSFTGDPLLPFNDLLGITTPYGPIWTTISRFLVALTGADPFATALAFKIFTALSAFGLALVAHALAKRLTTERGRQLGVLVLVAWQPTVLMETAGMAHNDATMLLAALGGLLLLTTAARGAIRGGLVLIAMAALIKIAALPLLGMAALWRLRRHEGAGGIAIVVRRWLGDAVAVGLLALLAFFPYWAGWRPIVAFVRQSSAFYINPLWIVPLLAVKRQWGTAAAFTFQNATRAASEIAVGLLMVVAFWGLMKAVWRLAPQCSDPSGSMDRRLLRHQLRAWAVATAAPAYLLVSSPAWYAIWAAGPIALVWAAARPAGDAAAPAERRLRPKAPAGIPWWLLLYLALTAFMLISYHTRVAQGGSVFGWTENHGLLVNDGTSADTRNWKANWIVGPDQPKTDAYSVEAQIRVDVPMVCGSYGIVVRGGYEAGIHLCGSQRASLRTETGKILQEAPAATDTRWHTYRVDVRGSTIRFLIDGVVQLTSANAPNRAGAAVGFWSDRTQISVRDFKVITSPPRT